MYRSEYLANEALAASVTCTSAVAQAGSLFAVRGPVRAYRKPSLFARILRAFV